MKILILTSSLHGTAAHHLDYLMDNPQIEVGMVVFNEGRVMNKKKRIWSKLKKTFRIGLFGALNGIRMRKWFNQDIEKYLTIGNLEEKCLKGRIPFKRTPTINCEETRHLFKQADVDLGISLGNGYISEGVFSIPKYGMVNIHHEILPQFQNAQSIIWQLYKGSTNTGYTIHKIDRRIDTGAIILQELIPIQFRETLADTVSFTYAQLLESSAKGLVKFLEKFDFYSTNADPQGPGNTYTTPGMVQFFRIKKQFEKMKNNRKKE